MAIGVVGLDHTSASQALRERPASDGERLDLLFADPLLARLGPHLDSQKDAELARTLARLEHLSARDRDAVALLAYRLVYRMVHHLATRLKATAATPNAVAYLHALSVLFADLDTADRTITTAEHVLPPQVQTGCGSAP
jgi:glutamyl-tRNA reductase